MKKEKKAKLTAIVKYMKKKWSIKIASKKELTLYLYLYLYIFLFLFLFLWHLRVSWMLP